MRYDYTTLGHVTVDVLADGTRRPGGSAFYSALQAARLGARALILTRGAPAEIERLLEPYLGELALRVEPAPATTTLITSGSDDARRQSLVAWAGPIEAREPLDTAILHLAPVARELPAGWRGDAAFVGLTPQGLAREWPAGGGRVALAARALDPPRHEGGARGERMCDAIVAHAAELPACAQLVSRSQREGAVIAVTAGAQPTRLLHARESSEVAAVPVARPRDDLGAGDVYAAAFFQSLHEGREPVSAARFAAAASAVRMEGEGARAIGTRAQVDARAAGEGEPGVSP